MRSTVAIALLISLTALLPRCAGNNSNIIEASGTIEGTDVSIGTEVAGKVAGVRVDEGSRVSRGDTLVVINDEDYRIQLRQASANLAAYESAYRLAVEGSRKEDVVQAEANYQNAQADYRRMKELLASQTITQKQYDDAYARFVGAQQTFEKLQRGSRPEEIAGARQRRDYADAQVDLMRKRVRDCSVLAPSNGTITLRAVEPGELVSVGTNVLQLTYLDEVKLTIYVSEPEYGRIKLGQKADVSIDSSPGRVFEGKVIYLSPNAEFTPKNVQTKDERTKLVFGVKIRVQNPDGALKPGLPADAKVYVQ